MILIKITKKQGFTFSSEDAFLEIQHGGGGGGGGGGWANWGQAPSLFKVKSAWTVVSLSTSKLFTSVSRQGKSVFDASVDAWKHFDHFRLTSIA